MDNPFLLILAFLALIFLWDGEPDLADALEVWRDNFIQEQMNNDVQPVFGR